MKFSKSLMFFQKNVRSVGGACPINPKRSELSESLPNPIRRKLQFVEPLVDFFQKKKNRRKLAIEPTEAIEEPLSDTYAKVKIRSGPLYDHSDRKSEMSLFVFIRYKVSE